uniref:Uncharacterized protein n=1 Tax=Trichogramma kaykai TaxID=54128 RepID=A0ABD2XC39_9HYME
MRRLKECQELSLHCKPPSGFCGAVNARAEKKEKWNYHLRRKPCARRCAEDITASRRASITARERASARCSARLEQGGAPLWMYMSAYIGTARGKKCCCCCP